MVRIQLPRQRSHEKVYQGRLFRIDRDVVVLPHGRVVTMDVVRHNGSVVLVPQPAPGKIILIRQYRYVIQKWIWELPAGSLEPGESPAAGARRECEEEIGLTPGRMTHLGSFYPSPGFCDEVMMLYRCEQLRPPRRAPAQDEDEYLEPKTFTLREAWSLVARGEIVDMKTVLGLVLLERSPERSHRPARRASGKRITRGRA